MATIGFLGAGTMAQGMIRRLIEAGHHLRVFNRTTAKLAPLAKAGALVAASPREAAEGAEAIFAMVGDDAASRAVWLGPEGALAARCAPGTFAIECSTLSHDWVLELAALAAAKGMRYLDCPVTGLPEVAARGGLTLLVGASGNDLAAARPLLAPLNSEIIHFGPPGAGTAYKLIVNLMGSIQIAAVAEAMLTADAAGLDRTTVAYAIAKGAAASPQVVRVSRNMVAADHAGNVVFSGRLRLKDTLYGVALAEKLGEEAILGRAAAWAYRRQVERGLGDANDSGVIDALRTRR